jgi:hypothetical protein
VPPPTSACSRGLSCLPFIISSTVLPPTSPETIKMSGCFLEWNYKTLAQATQSPSTCVYSEETLQALEHFLAGYDSNPTVQSITQDSGYLEWARSVLVRVRTSWALRIRGDSASSCSDTFSDDQSSISEEFMSPYSSPDMERPKEFISSSGRITIASLLN